MIVNLYKGSGSKLDVNNYRGIMLLCIVGKLFNWILAKRLTKYCDNNRILDDFQDGFMPKRGPANHGCTVTEVISEMLAKGDNPYVFFLDLSKAFDCIDRDVIYKNLRSAGIPRRLVNLVADMHRKTEACYRVEGERSKYISTIKGVPQGDPLSPIIFNLVINPMLEELRSHRICHKMVPCKIPVDAAYMYADDFVCICDNKKDLQDAIDICHKCINFFKLKANVKKSAVMRFFRNTPEKEREKIRESEVFKWGEDGMMLPNVETYKYLGMTLDADLDWIDHLKKCTEKYWMARNKCEATFKDWETDILVKLQMREAIIAPMDTYNLHLVTMSKAQMRDANVRQMDAVKAALNVERTNHNSLLRLMCKVTDVETLQRTKGINQLNKMRKQRPHLGSSKVLEEWIDRGTQDMEIPLICITYLEKKIEYRICQRKW